MLCLLHLLARCCRHVIGSEKGRSHWIGASRRRLPNSRTCSPPQLSETRQFAQQADLHATCLCTWHTTFAQEAALPAALLYRVLHHARILPITGESHPLKHQLQAGMVQARKPTAAGLAAPRRWGLLRHHRALGVYQFHIGGKRKKLCQISIGVGSVTTMAKVGIFFSTETRKRPRTAGALPRCRK